MGVPAETRDDKTHLRLTEIVGLVLTYYRRHPQRARTRLLDLLGEVLMPTPRPHPETRPAAAPPAPAIDPHDLWLKTQSGVAPLKKK